MFQSKILFRLGKSVNITSRDLQEGPAGEPEQETLTTTKNWWSVVSLKGSSSDKVWRTSRHVKRATLWMLLSSYGKIFFLTPQPSIPCQVVPNCANLFWFPGAKSWGTTREWNANALWGKVKRKGSSSQNTSDINFVIDGPRRWVQCIPVPEQDWLVEANRGVPKRG